MKSNPPKSVPLTTAQDIRNVFQSRDESSLQLGLTSLRDRLTIKYNEHVEVHDPRLQLLSTWLSSDEGAQTLFKLWEVTHVKQHVILSLIVSILGNTISLLSSHYSYHELASPLVNTLLSQQWVVKLNTYLASTYNDLIIFTLKLYLSLSNFGSGRLRKTLLDEFAWDLKTLPKLLHMRRKQKNDVIKNIMASPDIRSLFVLFLLSFVDRSSPSNVKNSFLEQRRDLLASMFKGLVQDPYPLVRKVFEILWDGMWSDTKIKRSLKVAIFNENTITQIIRLYDRKVQEGSDEDDVPAEVAHHFLLAICTRPGSGICFKDNGWYPREDGEGQSAAIPISTNSEGSKVHNKILAGVVKSLRLSDDPRQRELALRILKACPELVAGFWSASSLTLEPRLSSTWIGNISFLNSVISQPLPIDAFLRGGEYRSAPPPLTTILDNIVPTSQIKNHLSRGLQSTSPLVQHCTALTLSKCLTKYLSVMETFRSIQEVLQEDIAGLWTRRISELEREIRRRLPDLQVIVAFVQQRGSGSNAPSTSQNAVNPIQADLLVECSQRLLWLYHHALPALFAESRFDVAKVLQVLDATEGNALSQNIPGLLTVRQLHALRLLKESDQFSWSGKADSNRSNLSALLQLYVAADVPVIQTTVGDVLKDGLATSLLFQHNPEEFTLWLDSLATHSLGSEHGVDHSDSQIIITFLDECSQRCIKTPFKYLEELKALHVSEGSPVGEMQTETLPSPLLVTMVEQFSVRISSQKFNEQEILEIIVYLRRLLLRLICCVQHEQILHPITQRLLAIPTSKLAIPAQQELRALCLGLRYPNPPSVPEGNIEPSSSSSDPTYDKGFDFVLPSQGHLWTTNEVQERLPQFTGRVNSWLAVIHCADDVLEDDVCHERLVDLLTGAYCNFHEFKRLLAVVNQRMTNTNRQASSLRFIALALTKARTVLSSADLVQLKQVLLLTLGIKAYSSKPLAQEEGEAFARLIASTLDPMSDEDKKIAIEYTSYWSNLLQNNGGKIDELEAKTSLIWVPFMTSKTLLALLDHFVGNNLVSNEHLTIVLDAILNALCASNELANTTLSPHISTLITLHSLLSDSASLEILLANALEESVSFLRQLGNTPSITQALQTFKLRNVHICSQIQQLDIPSIVGRDTWTPSTARIITSLIYLNAGVRINVIQWLESNAFRQDVSYLASLLHALLDSAPSESLITSKLLPHFQTLVESVVRQSDAATKSSDVLVFALKHVPTLRSQLAPLLQNVFPSFNGIWSEPLAALCKAIVADSNEEGSKVLEDIVADAWKWATSLLAEPAPCSLNEVLTLMHLVDLLEHTPSSSSVHSLADTALSVAIQNHLAEKSIVTFIHTTAVHLKPKPANTNRMLQSIIQHPRFYDLCSIGSSQLREGIISLLHFLFHLHPTNTCQPSHLEPFGRLYGGTLSVSDLKLLSIFRLYETTRKVSLVGLLARSSQDTVETSHSLLALDSNQVFRTCLAFPQWRDIYSSEGPAVDSEVYDPVYIILLFAFWLKDDPPSSALSWVRMFRTNVVSLLIRSLSSHEASTRQSALVQLAQLTTLLQNADFVEQPHVLLVMDLLRDQIRVEATDEQPPRLPAYMTLHLAHSLRGIFYPSHFTYPLTARHLLQRPELDSNDVPMLLGMLYSSGDQWKQEQLWIIRFLTDGLVGKKEWQIMSKRHTWDLIASQYRRLTDKVSRHAVLELLTKITCLPSPTFTLVTKSALLEWIEEQLRHVVPGEETAWLKIIENSVIMMNTGRSTSRVNQEWQNVVLRCLLKVLESPSTCHLEDLLRLATILRRLDSSVLVSSQVSLIISNALDKLRNTETDLAVPINIAEHFTENRVQASDPPHRTGKLWVRPQTDPFLLWGHTVEGLWQVALEAESHQEWNDLTNRLLLWRTLVGEGNTKIGEWARRQMLETLSVGQK